MVDKAVQAPTAKAKAGEEVAVAVWEIPSTTTARTRAPALPSEPFLTGIVRLVRAALGRGERLGGHQRK